MKHAASQVDDPACLVASPFEWSNEQTTGIDYFDHDHHLISIAIQLLNQSAAYKDCHFAADKTIHFLTRQSLMHFAREEAVMQRLIYPQAGEHIEKHDEMRRWLGSTLPMLGYGMSDLNQSILGELNRWWAEHTETHDAGYVDFLAPFAEEARRIMRELQLGDAVSELTLERLSESICAMIRQAGLGDTRH